MESREFYNHPLFNDSRLIAYYRLENVNDSKGSYTLTNNGTTTFSAAKFNNGANFGTTNTTKSLTRTDSLGLSSSAARTLCFWAKMNTELSGADVYPVFISICHADIDIEFRVGYWRLSSVNKVAFDRGRKDTGTSPIYRTGNLGTTDINHFAISWDGTTLAGYFNGELVGTSTPTGNGADGWSNGFGIGCENTGTIGSLISATIDDMPIFNAALSATEIRSIYQYGSGSLFFAQY